MGTRVMERQGGIVLMYLGVYVMIEESVTECFLILGMEVGRISILS
jgi:hypothetical protein